MKELELAAIKEVISLYTDFLDKGLVKEVSERAKFIYNELTPGHTLLSKVVNSSVGELFSLGYPNVAPNWKIPTKKEVEEIIENLKKRKQELEND